MRVASQTLDSNGELHSFNDQPAKISSFGESWYKHGFAHRENDLPARVYTDESYLEGSTWCIDGIMHREGDKPAYVSRLLSRWVIQGTVHRVNGPALIYVDSIPSQFTLYDLNITEEQHKEIIAYAKFNTCPLWLSFLVFIEAVTEKELMFLAESSNNWETPLPVTWAVAALGLNEEKLEKAYNNPKIPYAYGFASEEDVPEILDRFLKVARFETRF